MAKKCWDVLIVGGGPIGTYTAYQLADKGFDVVVVEKKNQIGEDIVCAGVISKEAFKRYDLPAESILSRIDSFTFISPFGQRLEYIHPDVFAYVVDRKIFDKNLATLARKFGVEMYLSKMVKRIEEEKRHYRIYFDNGDFYAKSVVLATGVDYKLQNRIGMGKPEKFFHGAQVEIPLSSQNSKIEIHLGQKFAPGSFGWIIPSGKGRTRVGVIVENRGIECLKRLLKERVDGRVSDCVVKELKMKLIANGPIKKSVKGRIIAVGEAAGQVKTTTGGGLFFGLLCSEIAVDKLCKTLNGDGNLEDYEMTWRSVLLPEFEIGKKLRMVSKNLSDEAIEKLFTFVKKNRFWVQLLIPKINFDFHSDLVSFCLKSFSLVLKHY